MNPIRAGLAETPAPFSAQGRRMDLFTIRVPHQERSLMVRTMDGGKIRASTCVAHPPESRPTPRESDSTRIAGDQWSSETDLWPSGNGMRGRALHTIMWGKLRHDAFPIAQKSGARIVAQRRQNVAPGFSPEKIENQRRTPRAPPRRPGVRVASRRDATRRDADTRCKPMRVATSCFFRAEARSYARSSLRDWRVRARRGWTVEQSLLVRNADGKRIDA